MCSAQPTALLFCRIPATRGTIHLTNEPTVSTSPSSRLRSVKFRLSVADRYTSKKRLRQIAGVFWQRSRRLLSETILLLMVPCVRGIPAEAPMHQRVLQRTLNQPEGRIVPALVSGMLSLYFTPYITNAY